ncbi:MAG: hypothetical protein M0R21_09435 [Lentimicrobiaceae bacterium]|nr:hypothetical protein [Lentimicrobiaceae bacterium]
MKKLLTSILLSGIFTLGSMCQELELEKTYQIPGKADINDLANIYYNDTTGVSTFTYITKEKSDIIKFENYIFDKDFNFIKNENDELDISAAKSKYSWWNYLGDEYATENLYVDEKDDLMLKKKATTYTYQWDHARYTSRTKILDKIKLRNEEGEKYFHYRNWWSEDHGEYTYILCGINEKKDKLSNEKKFHLLKLNQEAEIIKDIEIKFDYPQEIACPRFVDKKSEGRFNDFQNDIIIVFAPKAEGSKVSDPNKTNFTYLRVDCDLNIIDKISFTSPCSFWSIEDYIIDDKTNSIYLLGASLQKNKEYYNELSDTKKFDGFQVMKIAEHKLVYVNSVSIDELSNKIAMPPSQKKSKPYEGKRFFISEYSTTSAGYLFVVGQSWYVDAMGTLSNMNNSGVGLGKEKKIKYSDCFGFGFDKEGKLIGQYIFDTKGFMGGNDVSTYQYLFVGQNPQNIYWFVLQPLYWNWNPLVSVYDYKPIKQPPLHKIKVGGTKFNCDIISSNFGKIDLGKNLMSEFSNYQINKQEKKFYYLCPALPFLQVNDNKLILFGTQSRSKGKTLWFARIRLD